MKTIHVDTAKAYDVHIGQGLLDRCGELTYAVCRCSAAALIADDTVFSRYGQRVYDSLTGAGLRVVCHTFPHGEDSKNLLEYAKILNMLADAHLTRSDVVIALGGGVTGDLAGFAAATYLRGVKFVQLPTTLLAAVDSSVGGKTAVDLPAGKNLAGCFYQPDLVVCDTDVLAALPEDIFRDGCAEVAKYAVLGNPALYALLCEAPLKGEALDEAVSLCVAHKRDIVARDECEHGERRLLNLGHTFGHAVESCSRYTVSHGQAVSIGMAMMARAGAALGFCTDDTVSEILALLARFSLPTACRYPADMLLGAMLADKKISGDTIHLIVPEAMGRCRVMAVPVASLPDWLHAGGAV